MNTIFFGSFFINNFGNFASKNEISRSVYPTLLLFDWLYLMYGGYTTKINT